jgi:serine/threonine protein phosphatase PrpC
VKKNLLSTLAIIVVINYNLFAVKIYSATIKGRRPYQEDVITVDESNPNRLYCGIFDGHAGDAVAVKLGNILLTKMVEAGFKQDLGAQKTRETITEGFLSTNSDILREYNARCPGSTALVSFILNYNTLVVANAGDCRAVLCKSGRAVKITTDHKAADPHEVKRVNALGGYIFLGRVDGTLAVSRAFGDYEFLVKGMEPLRTYVSPEPDVFTRPIEPDDQFLIMASDGLWDTVESEKAVEIVRCSGGPSARACHELINIALGLNSMDNISVIIIDLKN